MNEKDNKQKSVAAQQKDRLFEKRKNAWSVARPEDVERAEPFCEEYKRFMAVCKTEREACTYAVGEAKKAGFVPFDPKASYRAGDKVYVNNRGKAVILAVIGTRPVEQGVRIAASHIDSPRLDLKQHPLYEDSDLGYFKTHYYGGIRKYQWPTVPLALHGVVIRADGTSVEVNIGEDDNDPCFIVTDLLPHLATEQSKRTLSDGIRGEELNILVGSRPFNTDEESEQVKLNVLSILNKKYGITERDLITAELEAVPAARPRDVGFDRSMVGAYGHDDRVCAYPSLRAALAMTAPSHTVVTVLADKEETGSDGNTGLNSAYLNYFIQDLAAMQGGIGRIALSRSECLSADVNAAFDPTFADAFERRNSSFLGHGVVVTKYTGSRGKGSTSDASAEFTARVGRLLDKHEIVWQTGELGKVDNGGGGTVAKYVANLNVDVIDVGVPVLAMHSPFEVVSKLDVYMLYRAIHAFFMDE